MTKLFNVASKNEGERLSLNSSGLSQGTASRRSFLRRSLLGAALVAPAGLLAACSQGQSTSTTATGSGTATNTNVNTNATAAPSTLALPYVANSKQAFVEIMNDENEHVTFLKNALTKAGAAPRPKPVFKGLKQTDLTAFADLSRTFENVGVGAYLMAAPAISNKAYLAAAGSILTVEARHAGFLDGILSKPLSVDGSFDKPMAQADIVKGVSPFIASLNGGHDPAAPLKNDVDILNFALLLEYLEAEFYNLNVPTLFK